MSIVLLLPGDLQRGGAPGAAHAGSVAGPADSLPEDPDAKGAEARQDRPRHPKVRHGRHGRPIRGDAGAKRAPESTRDLTVVGTEK
eukprot:676474-Prorocentrum_minimum.AAC.2